MRRAGEVARAIATIDEIQAWAAAAGLTAAVDARLDALGRARPPLTPATDDRDPQIMGVVNVTPDSFSDGGDFLDPDRAIAHGLALKAAGADILDVGGESTRPGAAPVGRDEELRRVLPVVAALAEAGAVVSIDSRHAVVMRAALSAGAAILNDVTALDGDPDSLGVAADSGVPVVLMHMRGDPRTMQAAPRYDDAPLDVYDFLAGRLVACAAAGIDPARIVVDPGIGFGKTVDHNVAILRHAALFHGLGCRVLVGVSRKSFIARLSGGEPAKQRLGGSLAAGLAALDRGAQILRAHDVAQTRQAVAVWRALADPTGPKLDVIDP
ncbi:MAG: dihydropteroate synthase [Alphaproteobacteria bacterium]